MHLSRCLIEGGFKINRPPKNGKDPMSNEKDQGKSNEASQPRPTQAGRIELCQEAIKEAIKCLSNGDKQCVIKLIEGLIKNQCHDGRLIGKEIADGVRELVRRLWLTSSGDNDRCELLKVLRDLGISKNWTNKALHICTYTLRIWLDKCGIDWENKAMRSNIVRVIEDVLREKIGWDEVKMCEELWRFIGVDIDEFRRYGIEPCSWLEGLEELNSLKNPYWLGLKVSDLAVIRLRKCAVLALKTTNSIDAIYFTKILNTIKIPSLKIEWKKAAPTAKYIDKSIVLSYYMTLGIDEWPWLIKLSADELEGIIKGFTNEGLAMFVAGLLDGDGMVWYSERNVLVGITACKACPILDILKKVIAERFGIVGSINSERTADVLDFGGEDAVKLLRRVTRYVHHPLKRLRAELILALYDGRISRKEFERLYDMTKYKQGESDVKRNHALEATTQAAPQTHTHGEPRITKQRLDVESGIRTRAGLRQRVFHSRSFLRDYVVRKRFRHYAVVSGGLARH
jgi:hypothetical protein